MFSFKFHFSNKRKYLAGKVEMSIYSNKSEYSSKMGAFYDSKWKNEWELHDLCSRSLGNIPIERGLLRFGIFADRANAHFLSPIIKSLKNDFSFYRYYNFSPELLEDLNNLDLLWLEWGYAGYILDYLKPIKPYSNCKIVVRLHDWEIFDSNHVQFPNWDVADHLIFTNPVALDEFRKIHCDQYDDKVILIANTLDEQVFEYQRKEYNKQILMVSLTSSERKNYPRALRILRRVLEQDSEFQLTLKTDYTEKDNESFSTWMDLIYEFGIENHVSLISRKTTGITKEFLNTKMDILPIYQNADIILSTSSHETFHYSIGEGILSGCYPVVYPWEWGAAKWLWGEYVAENEEDAANRILNWSRLSNEDKVAASIKAKDFTLSKFGLKKTREIISKKLFPLQMEKTSTTVVPKKVIAFIDNPLESQKCDFELSSIIHLLQENGYRVLVVTGNSENGAFNREEIDGVPTIGLPIGKKEKFAANEIFEWWQPDLALMMGDISSIAAELCLGKQVPYLLFIQDCGQPIFKIEGTSNSNLFEKNRLVFTGASHIITDSKEGSNKIKNVLEMNGIPANIPVNPASELSLEDVYIISSSYITGDKKNEKVLKIFENLLVKKNKQEIDISVLNKNYINFFPLLENEYPTKTIVNQGNFRNIKALITNHCSVSIEQNGDVFIKIDEKESTLLFPGERLKIKISSPKKAIKKFLKTLLLPPKLLKSYIQLPQGATSLRVRFSAKSDEINSLTLFIEEATANLQTMEKGGMEMKHQQTLNLSTGEWVSASIEVNFSKGTEFIKMGFFNKGEVGRVQIKNLKGLLEISTQINKSVKKLGEYYFRTSNF